MTLGELRDWLQGHDSYSDLRFPTGFSNPCSYRGYYDQCAFVVTRDVTLGEMLKDVKEAIGSTFEGYKGGEFTMSEWTEAWLVEDSSGLGETIGIELLRAWLQLAKIWRQ